MPQPDPHAANNRDGLPIGWCHVPVAHEPHAYEYGGADYWCKGSPVPAAANIHDMSEIPAALARAFRDLEAAAREVDAFLDPKDAGPPFKFDGKRLSAEAELALLSMHAYLNDVEAARG